MAQLQPKAADKLLQRPLYVFDLPEGLLYTLQLRVQSIVGSAEEAEVPTPTPTEGQTNGSHDDPTKASLSCALCSLTFTNLQEQRSHVRSDLHGYNLKQKLRGKKAVGENEFERLVGELNESLSGSDDTSSEDEDGAEDGSRPKDTTLNALLKRQAKLTDGDADDAPVRRKKDSGKPPLLWFTCSKLPSNTRLGFYRAVFTNTEQANEGSLVQTIQQKQLAPKSPPKQPPKPNPSATVADDEEDGGVPLPTTITTLSTPTPSQSQGPHYFLCMIGGGHFAAMLVSLTPKSSKQSGIEDRSATVLAHKTFHRYTTRRKQGGSQSSNDNSKGNAHSAGAGIRRYNETALIADVRALLAEWRAWIDSAELLFVRATGSTNRRTLFGPYEEQVLSLKDERLRGFPFSTRRATQSELMKGFVELTRVKVSVVDEEAEARRIEEAKAAAARRKDAAQNKLDASTAAKKANKPLKQDEEAAVHTTQLQALIRRSKAPALLTYLQANNLSPGFLFHPPEQNHHAPTPLHLAAASNSGACVLALLTKSEADPAIKNGEGKTAFDIAGDRNTRDTFRLARNLLGEARWDWPSTSIPTPLSQTEFDARSLREKEEKAAEEAAEKSRRKAEEERIRKEDQGKQGAENERKFGKGNVLSKPVLTAEQKRQLEGRGMTEEMRMRLEREKRARAAEERIKRMTGQK
ncbi:hypothetical protein LTR78_003873 [Recurvomyces mirabilis]|uniref:VLRF1 domain-containing protein n=1 Tax=Recurvomyces mirabilis TaxID=574656 RepID=A0AAE1C2X7_9PEZI|nr:hypothetical protein LTR78_003873 [Recurvomyces mirabilis]KAK5153988.1 hypothetical protein LTS14_007208 [Recurvomyces mirabilis]